MRAWEKEQAQALARLRELEEGAGEVQAILAEARKTLWRLRESLQEEDVDALRAVFREVVTKVEVRFGHRPWGKGRTRSTPTKALLYVRPGLGISNLGALEI